MNQLKRNYNLCNIPDSNDVFIKSIETLNVNSTTITDSTDVKPVENACEKNR